MDFGFEQRLAWLDNNHYQFGHNVFVEEREAEGEAKVDFQSAERLLSIKLTEKNAIRYLKQKKVADGVVLKFLDQGVELHLLECKKSMTPSNWLKAKAQLEGALLNALAFCGLMNLRIQSVVVYTAFRFDQKMSDFIHSTNPALLKTGVGVAPNSAVDWNQSSIQLQGHKVNHIKIQLDPETGLASYNI